MLFYNIFPSMRSPTNIVLLSMAVCDLLTIALPAPWWLSSFTCQSISFLVRYFSKWSLSSCDILALHYVHHHDYPLHASKHFRTKLFSETLFQSKAIFVKFQLTHNTLGLLQYAVNDILTNVSPAPRWLALFCLKHCFFFYWPQTPSY